MRIGEALHIFQAKMATTTIYDLFRHDTILPFHVLAERATEEGLNYSQFLKLIAQAKAARQVNENATATEWNYELRDKEETA